MDCCTRMMISPTKTTVRGEEWKGRWRGLLNKLHDSVVRVRKSRKMFMSPVPHLFGVFPSGRYGVLDWASSCLRKREWARMYGWMDVCKVRLKATPTKLDKVSLIRLLDVGHDLFPSSPSQQRHCSVQIQESNSTNSTISRYRLV